jgi:predicted aconitase with swiveling domain
MKVVEELARRSLAGGQLHAALKRYKFFMVGTAEAPVLEVAATDLVELGEMAIRTRFVVGRMVEVCGEATAGRVLIPTARIQLIAESE